MACNFRLYSCLTERIICDGRHLGKRLGNLTLEGRAARLERKGGVVVFYDEKSVSRNSRTENFDAVKPAGHSDGWSVRAFDVFVAVLGLMFFAPILLAIAIAIKLELARSGLRPRSPTWLERWKDSGVQIPACGNSTTGRPEQSALDMDRGDTFW